MSVESPPFSIIEHYFPKTETVKISVLGAGNINDTFLVQSANDKIVLQRINEQVFPDPQALIHNLQQLDQHLQSRQKPATQRWKDTVIIPTRSGQPYVQDKKGNLWRALSYIDNSLSVTKVKTSLQAQQTGWALGHFHTILMDLNVETLLIPLPGFHHLSTYLENYDKLTSTKPNSKKTILCREVIQKHRNTALSLERAAKEGKITQKVIHGDPKIANILFDQDTGKAVSIIDLDTVGPGFIQHDIGDCLRSICNTTGEKEHVDDIKFDLKLCEITLTGYFEKAAETLSPTEKEYIYDGIQAITFELGLRFFTDYLQGNIYFKCANPEDTLEMALVQFGLYRDITNKEAQIRKIISRLHTVSD